MFSDFFSKKQRTSRSAGLLGRPRRLSVEPLEDRRLLGAAPLHHAVEFGRAELLALPPFVIASQHASAAMTNAATLSAQASTTAAATTTTVAVSPATSTYGQQVALTATVTTSDSGTLGGKVQFFDGGVAIGTARLNSSGQATLNLSNLSVGDHSITATYLGNTTFGTSTSDTPATLTVSAASTYTLVTASANPVAPDGTLTLTAHVLGVPTASGNEGGDSDDGCDLRGDFGSRLVAHRRRGLQGHGRYRRVTDLGSAEVSNGVARLSTSSLAAGDYTITATFTPGDGNYVASTSQAVMQSVSSTLAATAIHVSMSPNHGLAAGDAVTYTVTVKAKGASSTSTTPSGTVSFVDAVTGVALTGSPVTLTNGTATLATTYTTDPIIVTFTPDYHQSRHLR